MYCIFKCVVVVVLLLLFFILFFIFFNIGFFSFFSFFFFFFFLGDFSWVILVWVGANTYSILHFCNNLNAN